MKVIPRTPNPLVAGRVTRDFARPPRAGDYILINDHGQVVKHLTGDEFVGQYQSAPSDIEFKAQPPLQVPVRRTRIAGIAGQSARVLVGVYRCWEQNATFTMGEIKAKLSAHDAPQASARMPDLIRQGYVARDKLSGAYALTPAGEDKAHEVVAMTTRVPSTG